MGMTVFSGMLTATLLGVILVPALFVLIDRIVNRGADKAVAESAE
jgi:Cu/Ag efflux pump CusA